MNRHTTGKYRQSICELEGWKEALTYPGSDASGVERRFYALQHVPVKDLAPEDIRFLIVQQSVPDPVVAIALAILRREPFIETEYYGGDLFKAVLLIHVPGFWEKNETLRKELIALFDGRQEEWLRLDLPASLKKELVQAVDDRR